jgi:hypothetical protein
MEANSEQDRRGWRVLLRPRWLVWTGFCLVACAGMLALGDWQLHRALSGNELSWAYTFEWPLFAIFCGYFWVRTCREELRHPAEAAAGAADDEMLASEVSAGPVSASMGDEPAQAAGAESYEDYVARLRAEIQSDPRWRVQHRGRR